MNKKLILIIAVFALAFVVVAFALPDKQPYIEIPNATTPASAVTEPPEPPQLVTIASVDAPLWNRATSANGYCEGECWEGICPFFEGYPEPAELPPYTESDVEMLARMVWGEARGCTPDEWRLVVWTVLQRVDADEWGGTIEAVITAQYQFVGYRSGNPIDPDIYAVCVAELEDWWHGADPPTHEVYAPTAPYYYFDGDGSNNWFREEWR